MTEPIQPAPPFGRAAAIAAAGAAGFSVMAAELTAVRLLAPHFGDSAYVWTNVIGVILAAMALGATLGGRLAGGANAARWPFRLLLGGTVLLLLAPWLAPVLGSWLLPDQLALDVAMRAMIRGSLVATAVVFAPPLLLLAAVSPLLVVSLARGGLPIGRAAGDVAAASTLGSLVGTFAATHWLVPSFGCRIALSIAAAVLALAAIAVAPRRQRVLAVMIVVAALANCCRDLLPLRPPPDGRVLLAERETAYQFLQVLSETPPNEPTRRLLVINEGLDSFHSLWIEGSVFTDGAYYDWHAIAPLLAGDGRRPAGMQALSIGDAAGTLRAVYGAVHSQATVDAVDIDAATMALGDELFPAAKAPGERYAADGRLFLQHSEQAWHVVHIDAYAHQVYIPAHLASREFFTAVHAHLLDGGVVACNVGALDRDDPVLHAIGSTLASVFGDAWAMLVPNSRNALLLARRSAELNPGALASFAFGAESDRLSQEDREHWRGLVQHAADPNAWFRIGAGELVLTDDRPVLDELLFDSYVDRTDPEELVSCSGSATIAAAELEAFGAYQRADWHGVLDAVGSSSQASAYLRELAGDARFWLRQLDSAVKEYQAGLASEPAADAAARLQQRIDTATSQLQPVLAGAAAGRRNGWLAIGVVLAGLLLGIALRRR